MKGAFRFMFAAVSIALAAIVFPVAAQAASSQGQGGQAAPSTLEAARSGDDAATTATKADAEAVLAAIEKEVAGNPSYPDDGAIDTGTLPIAHGDAWPRLGWVYLEEGTVAEYEFYFDDAYVLKTKYQEFTRSYDPATLINVRDYGATGDGSTDDTAAIGQAVTHLNDNGGILYFPLGTYNVSIPRLWGDGMLVTSEKKVEVDFLKSTVRVSANSFKGYDTVQVQNCSDAEVRNGILVGDRRTHEYTADSKTHEWGMGVRAEDNALCNVVNMDISDMTGDGVYCKNFGEGTTNVTDCSLHHCRRQGISVTSSDIVNIHNTEIHFIGTSDGVKGTAPMCGIDLEPNDAEHKVNYVLIDNVNISDNTNYGLVQSNSYSSAVERFDVVNSAIEDIEVENGGTIRDSTVTYSTKNGMKIKKCTLENSYFSKQGNLLLTSDKVDNCVFEGEDLGTKSGTGMRILPLSVTVTNSTFKNVQGTGSYRNSATVGAYGVPLAKDPSYKHDGWNFKAASGHNTYEGCSLIVDKMLESGSAFKDCYIYKSADQDSVTLKGETFEDCMFLLKSNPLGFRLCTLANCGFSQFKNNVSEIRLAGSTVERDDAASQDLFPGSFTSDASTFRVFGKIDPAAFSNIGFANGSKIVLDRYPSVRLDIPKSEEGADYTVEYPGKPCVWTLDAKGKLTVKPESGSVGALGDFAVDEDDGGSEYRVPWQDVRDQVKSVAFEGTVRALTCKEMFAGCANLADVDLSGLDTAYCEDMSGMFRGCVSLTTLDLSQIETSRLKDLSSLFAGCSKLSAVYASPQWNVEAVASSGKEAVFNGCVALKGGNGTTYDEGSVGGELARVDEAGSPGYFHKPKVSIEAASVTLKSASAAYTGAVQRGIVKNVMLDGVALSEGKDYSVSAKSGKAVGSYAVTVTGINAYKGTAQAVFTIVKAPSSVKIASRSKTYTGKALAYDGKVTRSGSAGKVTYSYFGDKACKKPVKPANVKAAGTYYVKATLAADANHKGATSAAATFTIAKAANPMSVAGKTATVKPGAKKAASVKAASAYRFAKKAVGKVTYSRVASGSSKWLPAVSKGAGDITVKAGAPKGKVLSVRVKVTAAGDGNHNSGSKVVTVKVRTR